MREGTFQSSETYQTSDLQVQAGSVLPFGASVIPGGVNFSIYSRHATACALVLFWEGEREPFFEVPIPDQYRIGDVYAVKIMGLDYNHIEYGYRFDGPHDPQAGHRFKPNNIVLDPYARAIGGRIIWGKNFDPNDPYQHRARIVTENFNWGFDRPLNTPIEDLIIYEMHVRGFTQHPSSRTCIS